VVTGAVVPTVTVTACAALPLICTEELDKVQALTLGRKMGQSGRSEAGSGV
jgi:hypothetical protein